MAGEFFDHAQSENRLFDGVMQHVEADQSGVEITVGVLQVDFRFRHSITNRIIEVRAVTVKSDLRRIHRPRLGLSLSRVARIIDGNRIRDQIKGELKPRVSRLAAQFDWS